MSESTPWYRRLGPALITACVVIGPGSILTSSNVGVKYGYSLSWVVIVSVFFMLVFMSMGARLGVSTKESAGTLIANRVGRWFAVLIGISVFFISAAFQFGNNLGVHYALATYVDSNYLVVAFNALAIGFLLVFRNMYRALEKLMMLFVGIMLVAFLCNLVIARPRIGEWVQGLVPTSFSNLDLTVLALIGTTFVTTAAFYQSYLVRQKGWSKAELKEGMIDVRVGVLVMALITLMLMATPATVFHEDFKQQFVIKDAGKSELNKDDTLIIDDSDEERFNRLKSNALASTGWKSESAKWKTVIPLSEFEQTYGKQKPAVVIAAREFKDLPEVGLSLRPLFGDIGPHLFFLGVFAAAYSSFLVNSMIGGFILADGLGIGDRPQDRWPKIFTICVLLTGMGVGLYCIFNNKRPVGLIVAAQAVTVLAAPLVAGTLLWLTSNKQVMKDNVNGPFAFAAGIFGFLLLLVMSGNIAINSVIPAILNAFG